MCSRPGSKGCNRPMSHRGIEDVVLLGEYGDVKVVATWRD